MAWFSRDHTGRSLSGKECAFVRAIADDLAGLAAPQIDETETALTAEGESCLIVLIPHRALGGISIVVWLWAERAEVTWAHVVAPLSYHDCLDQGISVAHFRIDPTAPDFGPIRSCIRAQVLARLTVRAFPGGRTTVLVRDRRDSLREVGAFGPRAGWAGLFGRQRPVSETTVGLADLAPPSIAMPSGADQWFDSPGHGV